MPLRILSAVVLLLAPLFSYAQVAISEVMYDPAGTDTKREWVEVCNVSSGSVDLTTFKLFESSSNHGIVAFSGGSTLDASACGVVADDPASFKVDFPSYSGALFDSSFSLSNSGEQLILRTGADVDVDTTSYPATVAKGDGNTLHRSGSTYTAGPATPGSESGFLAPAGSVSSGTGDVNGSQVNQNGNTATPAPGVTSVINFQTVTVEPTPKLTVRATVPAESIAGVLNKMSAEAYNTKGQVVKATIKWNFGDGMSDTGADVRHAYISDGSYAVHVSASIDGLSDSATHAISVSPSQVVISTTVDGKTILVQNNGEVQLDLTAWKLRAGGQYYIFPDNTFILPKTTVKFPQSTTKITEAIFSRYVELLSPVGERVADTHLQSSEGTPTSAPTATREPLSISGITLAGLRHEDVPIPTALHSGGIIKTAQATQSAQKSSVFPVAQKKNAVPKENASAVAEEKKLEVMSQNETSMTPLTAAATESGFGLNVWYVAIGVLCFAAAAPLYFARTSDTSQIESISNNREEAIVGGLSARDFEIIDMTPNDQKPF